MLGWVLLTTPRERLRAGLRLVGELRVVPAPTLFALLFLQVLRTATVPVSAWASGLVVAQVSGSAPAGIVVAVTVFGLGIFLGETVGHAMWLLLAHVARIVDGRLRSEVRLLLGRATTLDTVDDPQLRGDVNHVLATGGARGYEKSLGVAAAAQVAMWFNILEIVLVALVLAGVSWWFALTAFVAMLIVRAVSQRSWDSEAAGETEDARGQRHAAYWTELGTGAAAAKEVRVFGMGQWVADRRRAAAESYLVPRWFRHRKVFGSLGVVGALAAVAAVWIVGWPVMTVARGLGSQADLARWLVAALGLLFLISRASLGYSVAYGHVVRAAAERVRQRLGRLGDPVAAPVSGVVAQAVQFGYGTGPPVLHELDLRIEPGEVIAVVGPNGAGKTTLMRLLAQLDTPTAGTLTGPRRDQVAVLFSEFARYPLPLRDNVSLGAPLAVVDDEAILDALRLAGADDVAAQVGLDTPLSPAFAGGVDLSGGQWQKVALARMVFAARHGRQLLIMDEPTAHLDAEQEADFYDRVVRTLSGPETMIVLVSHRLSTVRAADRILLLDGGRIAEQGNHAELLAADGAYATMFRLQAGRFASEQSR